MQEHRPSQNERILAYMREHGSITQREAIYLGCYRLSGRIFDLKAEGYKISTEMKKVRNSDGTTARIAVYRLAGE